MWWLIIGLLLGAFFFWLAKSGMKPTWYEWILLVLGVILILFAGQNFFMSGLEFEPRAATYLVLIFGIPGLILAAVGGVLPFLRSRKTA